MNHIEATFNTIDAELGLARARVDKLEAIRTGLISLYPALFPLGTNQVSVPIKTIRPRAAKESKPVRVVKASPRSPRESRGSVLADRAVLVAQLPEPITAPAVSAALKLDAKAGQNFITQSKGKGWLRRIGPGEYTRTAKFPATSKDRPNPPDSSNSHSLASLQSELELALKARDAANAAGQDKIAGIHQRKIDELTARLGQP